MVVRFSNLPGWPMRTLAARARLMRANSSSCLASDARKAAVISVPGVDTGVFATGRALRERSREIA